MKIVMIGGGLVGLCTATMLAHDGHDVTVLERDPLPPPPPETAWDEWERRGVNQFRMLHYLLPRFHSVIKAELPDLAPALVEHGALHMNPIAAFPAELTGGFRTDDERFDMVTGRRPVVESVVARRAATTDGLTVRRGAAVEGLLARGGTGGVPHVEGVRLAGGEEVRADVVIDATGRRSPAPEWLRAIGSAGPIDVLDDIGFRYYGRHYRSADGTIPPLLGGVLMSCGSISTLTLAADNGTWGIGIITSARDRAAHALADVAVWEKVIRSLPLVAHWIDAEPITGVDIMAKIEDRVRTYVIDGEPVVTGLLPLGDAWACTNPSLGRGIAIGMMQAAGLRELLRDPSPGAREQAVAWGALLIERVQPYVADTLAFDRHRLAEIDAIIDGRAYDTDDIGWRLGQALGSSAGRDPELLRGFLDIACLNARGVDVLARPGLAERAISLADPTPPPGPDRAELLTILGA